jgi:hypothetical protein
VRKLITGVDSAGRSCIVEEAELTLKADPSNPGFPFALVAATTSSPPPSRPQGHGHTGDLGVGVGLVTWTIVDYAADVEFPVHHTDTVDFDMVIEGTLVLILNDGEHPLESGDVLVVNGVDHAWKAGPAGCRLSVLSLGTPPPA